MVSGVTVGVLKRETAEFDLLALVKAKLFLDANLTDYDVLINQEIARAIEAVENFTGLAIGPQTRKVSYSQLTESTPLPYGPYLSLVSAQMGGIVDSEGLLTAHWPYGGVVVYQCGYNPDTLPSGLLGAVITAAAEFTGLRSDLPADGWKKTARPYSVRTWAD